eukprot:TRINITY_DN33130_c0_g2_i1.p2 TRINITY_DN33130_c0_g2~~TRINITY_DN33130_c0_g2_i1.p2  ORF type:complete len:231 (+),score=6.61 TRINITY_DN33130_c0_g2_i1:28-720(+)
MVVTTLCIESLQHCCVLFFFFFKQKTAYEIMPSLVGSEMCIRDRVSTQSTWAIRFLTHQMPDKEKMFRNGTPNNRQTQQNNHLQFFDQPISINNLAFCNVKNVDDQQLLFYRQLIQCIFFHFQKTPNFHQKNKRNVIQHCDDVIIQSIVHGNALTWGNYYYHIYYFQQLEQKILHQSFLLIRILKQYRIHQKCLFRVSPILLNDPPFEQILYSQQALHFLKYDVLRGFAK